MPRLSRRKIAAYTADQLVAGKSSVLDELAALIIDEGRERELPLIVRDIEGALLARGIAVADLESAYELTGTTKSALESLVKEQTGAKTVHFRTREEKDLLGGVRVSLPGEELDASVRRRLDNLKAMKV